MARIRCPECKGHVDINFNEYDTGDSIDCTECGAELIIEMDDFGRPKIITPKEKFLEEDEDFDVDEDD